MKDANMQGVVIFDCNPLHAKLYPTKHASENLEIIYSPKNLDADTYILEYLSILKKNDKVVLVTSDRELSNQAELFKVKTLSIPDFLEILFSKLASSEKKNYKEKPSYDTSRDFERLLKAFEKRLENFPQNE